MLRWADKPNVGSYLLYVAHDKEMTNPVYDLDQNGIFTPLILTQPMWTPAAALPDSQAGTAYYYRVVPCSYQECEALTHAEHSFDKLSRKVVLNQAPLDTPVGGTAPVACPDPPRAPPNHQVCQNDVTLSWQDFRTTEKVSRRRHAAADSRPHRGAQLHRPDRTGPELQTRDRDHRGRPDDVHVLRHDLPRGSDLLAGPGGRRLGNTLAWSDTGGLRQGVARCPSCCPRTARRPSAGTCSSVDSRSRSPRSTASRSTGTTTPRPTPSTWR